MLWGIDPLLDADLLYALRRMGHGDEIAIVDANFPAASTATQTVTGQPIFMNGVRPPARSRRCCRSCRSTRSCPIRRSGWR